MSCYILAHISFGETLHREDVYLQKCNIRSVIPSERLHWINSLLIVQRIEGKLIRL